MEPSVLIIGGIAIGLAIVISFINRYKRCPSDKILVVYGTGSGKSSLVQMLNGLFKPTEGTVYFDGKDIFANPKELRK